MWPAITSAAILIFTIVFDDFVLAFFTSGVDPQPLSVRIYSAIRFGIQPSINAVGTLMLVGSLLLIAIALLIPRLFGTARQRPRPVRRITGHVNQNAHRGTHRNHRSGGRHGRDVRCRCGASRSPTATAPSYAT